MILALTAGLAIVVLDHTALRAAPRSGAAELTALWQGDVLEVRGERAGYLAVYDYRRERGGYLRSEAVRPVELDEAGAPELLDRIKDRELSAMTQSRIHARRAGLWASIAYERARRREPPGPAAERALAELLAVHANDLGDDRRAEYVDAVLRVGAIRWGLKMPPPQAGPLTLSAAAGDPGQTCVTLRDVHRHGSWTIDVLSPGADDPEEGYVEFAGFAPRPRYLLVAREVKEHGRFRRRFEEFRLDDLALARQAGTPDVLRDFGRWQDVAWRRDTLALH